MVRLLFTKAPSKFLDRRGITPHQSAKWWYSWSRFNGLEVKEDKILMVHEVTNSKDSFSASAVISVCNSAGQVQSNKTFDTSYYMCANDAKYFLFEIVDDLDYPFPKYQT